VGSWLNRFDILDMTEIGNLVGAEKLNIGCEPGSANHDGTGWLKMLSDIPQPGLNRFLSRFNIAGKDNKLRLFPAQGHVQYFK